MKKITDIEEIKRIQLDILSALDSFCRKNNIQYTIIDGTLLGAVRHKGYIPWDDDIDVAMDRKNYEVFIKTFPDVYNKNYKLISLERSIKWDRAYACMYDDRTQLEYYQNNSYTPGVLIDIFPVDEVPDNELQWKRLKRMIAFYGKLSALKSMTTYRVSKSSLKNTIALLFRFLLKPISKRRIAIWLDKLAKSYNNKGYHYGYETAFGGVGSIKRFKLIDFQETIDYQFEDRIVKGLKNADSILTDTYGDYMQLPPLEQRVTHHSFDAYWK